MKRKNNDDLNDSPPSKQPKLPEDTEGPKLPENTEGPKLPEDTEGPKLPKNTEGPKLPENTEDSDSENTEGPKLPENTEGSDSEDTEDSDSEDTETYPEAFNEATNGTYYIGKTMPEFKVNFILVKDGHIHTESFCGNKELVNIVIGDSIQSIGKHAFL
jgi:hypothetical protein